ncbi:MAG TPA: molybdate ABC transporter substrate-binding protein [Pirellulales bacterium]|nr:molybdate ABC transporter substrate-binding protein [Pirellulales bacterium]
MAKTTTSQGWGRDWTVGVRVWIERHGQAVLGQGRAELLDAIGRQQSITAAAKTVGISYRKAWTMIQEINQAAGEPLVKAAVGGTKGGGATLTPRGRFAVDVYGQLHQALHESAAGVLQRITNPRDNASPGVHLAAAISLQEVIGELLSEYALREPTVRVRVVYGASNELADHLLSGAPGDLFISAEACEITRLEEAGRLVARTRKVVASNGLAVIGPYGGTALKRPDDLLSKKIRRIALAEPACPLGGYSQVYLQGAGVYDALLPKVLYVDNSRAVLSAVAAGTADAGVAFSSDAQRAASSETKFLVPHSQAAAHYVAGIVQGGPQSKAARALLAFITSPAAGKCFRRHGFQPAQA